MGGGYYKGDVAERTRELVQQRRTRGQDFGYRPRANTPSERKVHDELDPKNKIRECLDNPDHPNATPLAILMDITESRGDDVEIMFGKVPRLIGKTYERGLVSDPTISYCFVGDANSDLAPLQVGQFEAGNKLDRVLSELAWLEKGGGGTGQESYQLAAYFYAFKVVADAFKHGRKGYCFITGDEAPYPTVGKAEVERIIGDKVERDIPTTKIFSKLQEKFHTFFIFIEKPWETRQGDVDKEIEQRVKKAGGLYNNVDVRFSLLWHNFNDLDLHVETPKGEHIYYGQKTSHCGGELDVDRNAGGRETRKPVENTRWKKGTAPKGVYRVWVENYAFHEDSIDDTPFKVEICVGGRIQSFEGVCKKHKNHGESRVEVGRFAFDPEKAEQQTSGDADKYAAYRDEVVLAEWSKLLPAENIIIIHDPKGIVDVMLGIMSLKDGTRKLDEFLKELKDDEQTEERIKDMRQALQPLADACSFDRLSVIKNPSAAIKRRGANLKQL